MTSRDHETLGIVIGSLLIFAALMLIPRSKEQLTVAHDPQRLAGVYGRVDGGSQAGDRINILSETRPLIGDCFQIAEVTGVDVFGEQGAPETFIVMAVDDLPHPYSMRLTVYPPVSPAFEGRPGAAWELPADKALLMKADCEAK